MSDTPGPRPAGTREPREGQPQGGGQDFTLVRALSLARLAVTATLVGLGLLCGWLLVERGPTPDLVLLSLLLVALAASLAAHHVASVALGRRLRSREAGMRRIAEGLSRSLSPDAVVETLCAELGLATDADHVAVARVRQDDVVEVTVVAARGAAPASRTWLRPGIDEPEDGSQAPAVARPGAVARSDDEVRASRSAAAQVAAEEIARRVRTGYGLTHTLAAPLVSGRRFLGSLMLARRTRTAWSPADRRLLGWAAEEVAAALARAYLLEDAAREASIDALTGLPNRRMFDELLAIERPARRASDQLGLLMVDIDRFKQLNDRYGHATGDRVLRAVARALAAQVRSEDTAARYGGEEFAVLLRQASAAQAAEVAERIRRAVAALRPGEMGVAEPVTVSVGVVVGVGDESGVTGLVEQADAALYRAKRRGRDRVVAV